jgi:predicted metal-dependent enzyme (double-stranded beta helix superfamily)
MPAGKHIDSLSRRDVVLGGGAAIALARSVSAQTPSRLSRLPSKFDVERFVEDCKSANEGGSDAQSAVREVLARAISDFRSVLAGVGEPQKGGIQTLYRSAGLTILNIVWSPLMQLMPHEHNMWALIGIYTGREDNIFWQRQGRELAARTATALSQGSVTALPRDIIHSVTNPIEKLTGAIHIYGGDFFAVPRSEWDPETLAEREWDIQRAMRIFRESNERFFGR